MDEDGRIKLLDQKWFHENRKKTFEKHFQHWASMDRPEREQDANLHELRRHISEMFDGQDRVLPSRHSMYDPLQRTVMYVGGCGNRQDRSRAIWDASEPDRRTQIYRTAEMLWGGWDHIKAEMCPKIKEWTPIAEYNHYGAYAVPCVPELDWAMKDTYEKFLPSVARVGAFYLLTLLRIVRPTCVVLIDYPSSQILSFVLKHAKINDAGKWMDTPEVRGTRLVTPRDYQTDRLSVSAGWSFHAFRFFTPYALEMKSKNNNAGAAEDFEFGMIRLANTLNPVPLDITTALQQPTDKQAKCRRAGERKEVPVSKKQRTISFNKT